jgi:hypothetical protein
MASAPPRRRRVAALVATLVMVGCSNHRDSSPVAELDTDVRPFAEVQASDFTFEADPADPHRGIFRVSTTEPMICAIVWGATEAFGRFNNSLSMNGTGIVDHDVSLPDVVAGRRYYFRVQGTTADGTLYRSPTATFTIPATTPAPPRTGEGTTNLALDATVVDVSSEFGEGYTATNAIDGSGTTEWSTAGDGDDAYIVLDLGRPAAIGAVEFITRSMLDGTATTETYTVTVDDQPPLGPFPAGTPSDPNPSSIEATGQTIRFDVHTSTGGNVGAVEIRLLAL